MEYRTLIVEKKNAILQITFNRTEARNSINCEFLQELNTAFYKEKMVYFAVGWIFRKLHL